MNQIVKNAISLAMSAHQGQFRKFGVGIPYIQHPLRVAFMVSEALNAHPTAVAAALLHDVLEDTNVSPHAIENACGTKVLELVQELTNPSKLPEHASKSRAERKRIDREHLTQVSLYAKIIKLCDRIDNLNDVSGGPQDFQTLYAKESLLLLESLKGTDEKLEYELREAIRDLGVYENNS